MKRGWLIIGSKVKEGARGLNPQMSWNATTTAHSVNVYSCVQTWRTLGRCQERDEEMKVYSLPEFNNRRRCIWVCDVGGIFSIIINTVFCECKAASYNYCFFYWLLIFSVFLFVRGAVLSSAASSYLCSSNAHSRPTAAQWWSSWRGRKWPKKESLYSTHLDELQSPALHSQYLERETEFQMIERKTE